MNFKPVLTNILLKEIPNTDKIVMQDANAVARAEVVSIGSGLPAEPMQVRPGQVIRAYRKDCHPIELDGEKYWLIEQDVILVIEED